MHGVSVIGIMMSCQIGMATMEDCHMCHMGQVVSARLRRAWPAGAQVGGIQGQDAVQCSNDVEYTTVLVWWWQY